MGITNRFMEKAGIKQLEKITEKTAGKMGKDMMQLEKQIIVCQENQVEFEEYLKRIDENVKKIGNLLNKKSE